MTNPINTFNQVEFLEQAKFFREDLKQEKVLSDLLAQAISRLAEAAVELVSLAGTNESDQQPLLVAKISETTIQITGGNRNILLAAAAGTGTDLRLSKPRNQVCVQIFVFGHLSAQAETTLLTSFRIYPNGDITDGDAAWTIDRGVEPFKAYVAHLINKAIFDADAYWPEEKEIPSFLQKVPLLSHAEDEDDALHKNLKQTCIGFECNLKR